MVESITSNSGGGNDFEDESLLKLYLTPNSMYPKSDNSQNDSFSETLEGKIETQIKKKIEQLSYLDLQKSEYDESKYFVGYPLKYSGTVYQCPSFSKLNLREKVKLLCAYHSKITKNVSNQAKLQLECVPFPKLIKTSVNSPSSTLNNIEMDVYDEELKDNNNVDAYDTINSEYISKAGRISKRKYYSEIEFSEMKKAKFEDGDWLVIKNKSPLKSSVRTKKQPLEVDDTNLENKTISVTTISKTNAEIISKSKLFKEKDPAKNSRWAKMMKGVEQQKSKDKEDETKMKSFNDSLPINEETSEFIEDFDDSPIKRRVKPPPVKPKVGKMKKQEPYAELELTTQKAHTEKSINTANKSSDFNNASACSSTSAQKNTANMVQCPICSRDFIHTEIEEHASSCGENRVETRTSVLSLSTMTCRFCDEVFLLDKDYEEHSKCCSKR